MVRNRIRRRLREAIRLDAQADMAPGIDYVVVARRDVLTLPFEQLKDELSRRVARMKQPHAILIPKDDAPWDGVDCDADAAGGPRAEMFCFVTERLVEPNRCRREHELAAR